MTSDIGISTFEGRVNKGRLSATFHLENAHFHNVRHIYSLYAAPKPSCASANYISPISKTHQTSRQRSKISHIKYFTKEIARSERSHNRANSHAAAAFGELSERKGIDGNSPIRKKIGPRRDNSSRGGLDESPTTVYSLEIDLRYTQ
ncbi:hypothetical protein EVAR_63009_1 [Eumeta japonica]|uniref:Uncharacterized protein n=1 Tax=Eumeta variegata TaxID=151549 RepID=A0A4C1YX80_EUMVA|nr:hypothetical protein EVAR_63009_1 [Eumeta japonica]